MPEFKFLSSCLPDSLQELELFSSMWIATAVIDIFKDVNPTVKITENMYMY